MVLPIQQITAAIDAVEQGIGVAENVAREDVPYANAAAEWRLQVAYELLLVLAEAQDLRQLRKDIARDWKAACAQGVLTLDYDEEGESYLKWAVPLRRYAAALQAIYAHEPARTVTKDIESILRAAKYALSDRKVFNAPPLSEAEVHSRVEGILKCIFEDLKHKPHITKSIKNFEPDTGIPSIRTLIEYKYLSSAAQLGSMADELLADTRGYVSKEWTSFIYVIYETSRIRPESEWRQLLRDCGIDSHTTVVVLEGESAHDSAERQRINNKKPNPRRHATK